ncbi:MAG: TraR/DksA family transcriptional regulator [Nitrospinales bacterium]
MAKKKKTVKKKTSGKKTASKKKVVKTKKSKKTSVAKKKPVKAKSKPKLSSRKGTAKKKKTKVKKSPPRKTTKVKAKKASPKTKKAPSKKVAVIPKKVTKVIEKPKAKKISKRLSNAAFLRIKERIIQERKELLDMLQASQQLERNVEDLNFSNEIDLASSLAGREMTFTLSSRDRDEIKRADDALFRFLQGTYGICEDCSKEISLKRLEVRPLASYCIECLEAREGR